MSAQTVSAPQARASDGRQLVWLVALFGVAIHVATGFHYGYADDEMYYLACSRHLAAGYVDIPPLIAVVFWFVSHTLGTSMLAIKSVAALSVGALAWVTGGLTREMGGRRWAQGMAALAAVLAPMLMLWAHALTMNVLDPVLWTGAAWCVVRLCLRNEPRWWLLVGVLVGLGLLNKYTMVLWVAGLLVGMVLSPARRWFASPWFWAGCGLALLIFLPNLLWLVTHHFPFLKHLHYIREKYGPGHGPVLFAVVQVMVMNPVLFPLWAGGLVWLLGSRDAKNFRLLGWIFIVTLATFMATKGRDYYTMPPYPIMFAAGSVAWENWLARWKNSSAGWLKPVYVVVFLVVSIVLAPVSLPVLSYPAYQAYLDKLGLLIPGATRKPGEAKIPMYFAAEIGQPEFVAKIATIYNGLPDADRSSTALFVHDYQRASTLDLLGKKYGLPDVISGDIAFWTWGPRDYTGDSVLTIGISREEAGRWWQDVRSLGTTNPSQAPETQILLCHKPKQSLQAMWPEMRVW